MKSNICLFAVALMACCGGVVTAAESADHVSLKLDLVAWGETITGLTLKSGNHSNPVTAIAFRYSKPVAYSGPAILEISRVATSTSAGAGANATTDVPEAIAIRRKKNPDLVALASLPTDSKHVTVLLAPAGGGTFTCHVFDDDPDKLPFGRIRIHNLSPHYIAMRCNGTTACKLRTKQSVVVEPKNQELIYELAYEKDGEWVDQENNLATVKENEQVQLVVLKSDADFFTNKDGSRAGFLQTVILRRSKNEAPTLAEMDPALKAATEARMKREEDAAERASLRKRPAPKH